MLELPENFKIRMKNLLGERVGEFLASYEKPAVKGIRVNTLKITAEEFRRISPFRLDGVFPWEGNGFYVNEEKAGKTVLHAAGLYYVQEPSAACAAPLLQVKGGERVLDLCSAPGGKGTQLAQAMQGSGIIFLNDINYSRAKILSQNVERLGVNNAVVTCAEPEQIAEKYAEYFDKILVDAPCSGEGMFKKEPNAIPEWSEENVARCAKRQGEILDCAVRALKRGGRLVYSTCTFSAEEDELQVRGFLSRHAEMQLIESQKLYPHEVRGEGHFAALFEKTDGGEGHKENFAPKFTDGKLVKLYRAFEQKNLKIRLENLHLVGDALYSIPDSCPAVSLRALRVGVKLGEFKLDRFEPDHALAMALTAKQAFCVEVDERNALSYLGGNVVPCEEGVSGWRVITYLGYPLGWCKAVSGIAKNHLPKGLRI